MLVCCLLIFLLFLFEITERSVLMALVFYNKDMLEKVKIQRTQQFSAFVCYRKNSVKCNACAVARKIETDCFCRNVPISNYAVVRISRNLAKSSSETARMIYQEKWGMFNNTKNPLTAIANIAYVKILLEQR